MCSTDVSAEAPPDFVPDFIQQRQRQQQQILADAVHNPHNAILPAQPEHGNAGSSLSEEQGAGQDPHSPVNAVQSSDASSSRWEQFRDWFSRQHVTVSDVQVEEPKEVDFDVPTPSKVFREQYRLDLLTESIYDTLIQEGFGSAGRATWERAEALAFGRLRSEHVIKRWLREGRERVRQAEHEAATEESLCITIAILDNSRHTVGIDKLTVYVSEYTVSTDATLSIGQANVSHSTGEVDREDQLLFEREDGVLVYGQQATLNIQSDPEGYATAGPNVTVFGPDMLRVAITPSKLLHGHNATSTCSPQELLRAIEEAEERLEEHGITADLKQGKIARLDLTRTVDLPRACSEYEDVLKQRDLAHMPSSSVDTTLYWGGGTRNKSRSLTYYDKGLEQQGKPSSTARMEYALRKAETVRSQLGHNRVPKLLNDFGVIEDVFYGITDRLIPRTTTGKAMQDKVNLTQQDWANVRNNIDKTQNVSLRQLAAYAISKLSASELEALEAEHRQTSGRKAAQRVRDKIDELLDAAAECGGVSDARLYSELRQSFCKQFTSEDQ